VVSHTKKSQHIIRVSKSFFTPEDRVLILDDFLAYGDAVRALMEILSQAQVTLVGVGICVEKAFQHGGSELLTQGVNLHSLARVQSLEGGVITLL
jgi:xanthine phosphoribosyltransferase